MRAMMITTTEKLREVCERFATFPFVTLDTEFIREKTYWPVLCLIQIGIKGEAYCIDPLADELDMTPLFDLLQNDKVLKVFHAARQDLEIFHHLTGKVPAPLFDTQVAAMVCGFGESASYQQLVQELTGVALDKGMRYTDWSKRPLSDKQIAYALHDVTDLVGVYEKLCERLEQNGRKSWLAEELAVLTNPVTYAAEDRKAWQKVRCHLNKPQQIHVFAEICAWRERTAKLKNRPRRHIMKDEIIQELAVACPTTVEQMDLLRSLSKGFSKSTFGQELLEVIAKAMADEPKTYVMPTKRKALTNRQKNLGEFMRLLLAVVSDELGVAPKIIAGTDDIIDIIADEENAKAMTGWRYEAFGKYAEALKKGLLTFGYNPQKRAMSIMIEENGVKTKVGKN